MSIVYVNSVEPRCGIHQYGLRMFNNLSKFMNITHKTVDSVESYLAAVEGHDVVIINYYISLYKFLTKEHQDETKRYAYVYHEHDGPTHLRDGITLNTDPTHPQGIPRPIAFTDTHTYPPSNVNNPTIGSFGFGFRNKTFQQIVELVQMQFDTATIRLLMPGAAWGDYDGAEARFCAEQCRLALRKPGIKLYINHDFMSDSELFAFLRENDVNIFYYQQFKGRGCSSVVDYALGVNRPLAITSSSMFRHIYDERIDCYKTPLRTIICNGPIINTKYTELWSAEKLADTVKERLGHSEA